MHEGANCINNEKNSTLRVLTSCVKYTPSGQCLYCNTYNYLGKCTEYTNVDPATQIIPNAIKTWIKCMIENIVVIEYEIESCIILGLEDMLISSG